ncbi:MAG: hypothetical protein K2X27_05175 [Candidatus Obscuribacterales bacterium]|nr:hypothetical protein [Candidatus Obscuribacterales bacterium]
MTAVEENPDFIAFEGVNYVLAPVLGDYYDRTALGDVFESREYEVVIVDGPFAGTKERRKFRMGFQKYFPDLKGEPIIVVDDIDRPWDFLNFCCLWLKRRNRVYYFFSGSKACALISRSKHQSPVYLFRSMLSFFRVLKRVLINSIRYLKNDS